MKESLLVNLHGGHSRGHHDDGTRPIAESVYRAKALGLIQCISSHNTTEHHHDYRVAMEAVGLGNLAMFGAELSYAIQTLSWHAVTGLEPDKNTILIAHSDKKDLPEKLEHNSALTQRITSKDVSDTKKFIESTLEKTWGNSYPWLKTTLQQFRWNDSDLNAHLFERARSRIDSEFAYGYERARALAIATDEFGGFPGFYALVRQNPDMFKDAIREINPEYQGDIPEHIKIIYAAMAYHQFGYDQPYDKKHKGELLCFMPQELTMTKKVGSQVEKWRESGSHQKAALHDLFNFFRDGLTENEFKQLVWIVPHAFSIDSVSWFGRLIVRLFEGKDTVLFPSELMMPDIAATIHGIEVLNGAHPGEANRMCAKLFRHDQFKNKAKTGGSDDHHPVGLTAATYMEVNEVSTDGILDALRRGNTLPVSGLGESSDSWAPFLHWLPTVSFMNKLAPQALLDRLAGSVDFKTPVQKIHEQGLFPKRREIDWVK